MNVVHFLFMLKIELFTLMTLTICPGSMIRNVYHWRLQWRWRWLLQDHCHQWVLLGESLLHYWHYFVLSGSVCSGLLWCTMVQCESAPAPTVVSHQTWRANIHCQIHNCGRDNNILSSQLCINQWIVETLNIALILQENKSLFAIKNFPFLHTFYTLIVGLTWLVWIVVLCYHINKQ